MGAAYVPRGINRNSRRTRRPESYEVLGRSTGRLKKPDGNRWRKIREDELARTVMPSMQPLAVGIDSSEVSPRLRTGNRGFHHSDRGVLKVGEITVLAEQAEHFLEDASHEGGGKVVEREAADDVVERTLDGGRLDRRLVKLDIQVRMAISEWLEEPLFKHVAEEWVDLHDVEFISGTNGLEDLRRERSGPWSDLEDPLGPA